MGNQPWPQFQNGIQDRSISNFFSAQFNDITEADPELTSKHIVNM